MSNPFFDDALAEDRPVAPGSFLAAEPQVHRSFAEMLASTEHPADVIERIQRPNAALFDASWDAARLSTHWGLFDAKLDAVDRRNKAILEATGIKLDNPYRGQIDPRAWWSPTALVDRSAGAVRDWLIGVGTDEDPEQTAVDRWMQQLADVAAAHPDKAALIRPDVSPQQDVLDAYHAAQARAAKAGADPNATPLTAFAGSLGAGMTDPEALASLVLPIGGPAKSMSVLGRAIEEAVKVGAVNAAITAVSEPDSLAARRQLGEPTGLGTIAQDLALSFLSGAIPGAAVGALRGPARIAAEALDRDTIGLGRAAERIDGSDRAVIDQRPAGVAPDVHAQAIEDATIRIQDPAAPPPEPPVPRGEANLDQPPGAHDLQAGWARLSEDLQARAEDLGVPPEQAAHVGLMSPSPEAWPALLDRLAREKPETEADARRVIAAAMAETTRMEATARALSGEAKPFGDWIEATPATWIDALEKLKTTKNGEIVGAIAHPALGTIDVPYGNARFGIRHIERKHPEVALDRLPEIVARSEILSRSERSAELFDGVTRTSIRLRYEHSWGGPSFEKRWLVTAFDPPEGRPEAVTGRASDVTETVSSPPPTSETMPQVGATVDPARPVDRLDEPPMPEGLRAADIEASALRREDVASLVDACRT